MKSATAISHELDDIAAATKELTNQIKDKLSFGKNTVAILHGQPEMEVGELSAAISRELGCQVVGGTTAAGAVLTNEGFAELAVVLHVITDDECFFAAAISGSMESDPEKVITDTYQEAYRRLKEQDAAAEPAMVICIAPIAQSIASDDVLAKISDLCGSLPVFGFIAADDMDFCKQQVYLDGEAGGDRMAVLLLSGNLRPIFKTANLAGKKALDKRLVTKSRGNVICEIEGKPAFEYIKEFPFIDDQTMSLVNYQFFVETEKDDDYDGVAVSRALNTYDRETGEVTCFGSVPENSYIGLLYCKGDDVADTTEAGIKELLEQIKNAGDGYEYSTVLISTCNLRIMFLADMKGKEGDFVREMIPSNLTTSGIYCYGEIAPTSTRAGKATNRFHNATFTVCAF